MKQLIFIISLILFILAIKSVESEFREKLRNFKFKFKNKTLTSKKSSKNNDTENYSNNSLSCTTQDKRQCQVTTTGFNTKSLPNNAFIYCSNDLNVNAGNLLLENANNFNYYSYIPLIESQLLKFTLDGK